MSWNTCNLYTGTNNTNVVSNPIKFDSTSEPIYNNLDVGICSTTGMR